MKKFFLQFALKSLFTARNSEGPSLAVGLLLTGLQRYFPDVAPELAPALSTVATTLVTYAGSRFYSKAAKGPEVP